MHFDLKFEDSIRMNDSLHMVHKSGSRDERGKPVKETELYIGNKVLGMQARYDKLRFAGVTRVLQTVWKWVGRKLKIVHSHWKI